MKSPARDMAEQLEAAGLGAVGGVIHASREPETPDQTITLFDTGGSDPDSQNLADMPTFQVRVRANGYEAAYNLIWSVREELLGLGPVTINNRVYDSVWVEGDIVSVGMDENGRSRLTCNFRTFAIPDTGEHRS